MRAPLLLVLLLLALPAFAEDECHEPMSFGMGPLPLAEVVMAPGFFGCQRVAVGKSVLVEYPRGTGPTGLGAGYRLARPSENHYVVEVNLRFRRDADYEGKAKTDEELDTDLKEKLNDCLSWVNSGFKGPDGKSLEIRLSEDAGVPGHVIPIGSANFRANAEKYPADVNCPTAVHEIFHLLGLVDEYKERTTKISDGMMGMSQAGEGGVRTAYDCRTYGPVDSIMSDQWLAITGAMDYDEYEVDECRCKEGINCKELARDWDKPYCPSGSEKGRARYDFVRAQGLTPFKTRQSFLLQPGNFKKTAEFPATRRSILWPAQFRSITEPGCYDVNERYYTCAKNAYRTSIAMFGGCMRVPDYCKSGDLDWLE